ncbi:MAG TPA: phosphate ABC transporter permease PstA [Planctomycetota bacterium]|nr:phosphate ABC transporter permease PstA [Planctomycetota bacterium]
MKNLSRRGEPYIWITGGALAVSLVMTLGLILLILVNGMGVFWPSEMVKVTLKDGAVALGMVRNEETIPTPGEADAPVKHRIQLQVGNRDLYGQDFRWIDEDAIQGREIPTEAILLERREWGHFCGFLKELRVDGTAIASGPEAVWREMVPKLALAQRLWNQLRAIEKDDMGDISRRQESLRLKVRRRQIDGQPADDLEAKIAALREEFNLKSEEIKKLRAEMERSRVILTTVDGKEKDLLLAEVVRALRPNTMGFFGKSGIYAGRVWEFLWDEPRESNTEGGVFPAIFGTVMMVFIMTLAVVPLGVLAALYLREYARQGPLVRAVRIAVNNLAGVPSIVFGVFGLGFFIYFVGGSIDRIFFPEALPSPTYGTGGILWASLTMALLTVPVVIVATEEGLAAVPRDYRNGSLALGANKFETTWRIVLPNAMPGILTGVILAMARAAGEVAPLMITGVIKLAPTLPVDGLFPFVHFERKFMHLGFHIYDVGFQSPNVEAARPMVYTTTFLLLVIVVGLNLVAITARNRLRAKLRSSTF